MIEADLAYPHREDSFRTFPPASRVLFFQLSVASSDIMDAGLISSPSPSTIQSSGLSHRKYCTLVLHRDSASEATILRSTDKGLKVTDGPRKRPHCAEVIDAVTCHSEKDAAGSGGSCNVASHGWSSMLAVSNMTTTTATWVRRIGTNVSRCVISLGQAPSSATA